MNRTLHFYPFPLNGWHGGTMRLASSMLGSASATAGHCAAFTWDPVGRRWQGPRLAADATEDVMTSTRLSAQHASIGSRLKRDVFPSTLLQSGRHQVAEIPMLARKLSIGDGDTVILHTSYLAPAISTLKGSGARVICDVHDLVWRAHRSDALADVRATKRIVRHGYAKHARGRELTMLSQADGLLVAGWRDAEVLQDIGPAVWSPTGIPLPTNDRRARHNASPLRVGLIGNFEHSATLDSAHALMRSALARSEDVQIVVAGMHSDTFASSLGSPKPVGFRALGHVKRVAEFYDEIDALVCPVFSPSGMKCKLAEGAMAGKLVVTSPAGASGFPPSLRRHLCVIDDFIALSADAFLDRALTFVAEEGARSCTDEFVAATSTAAAAERVSRALGGDWTLVERPVKTPRQEQKS